MNSGTPNFTDLGSVHVPEDAPRRMRQNLGLDASDDLRISFVAGPGDVVGTYNYWREGLHDERVPIITYSSMFYELVGRLDAQAQIVTTHGGSENNDDRFCFSEVKAGGWTTRASHFRVQRRYAKDVVSQVDAFDPHVVLVSTDFPPPGWKSLAKGRKLVLTAHNTFWPMGKESKGMKGRILRAQLERHATALDDAVCTSAECSRQIAAITSARVRGLVQHPQIIRKYKEKHLSKVRKLLFLGRIEKYKGIFLLLEAVSGLLKTYPDLSLVFAGSGSEDSELRARIMTLGSANVTFVGRLDSDGVHQAIEDCDLVVCPTTSDFNEGLAMVGIEAAAHGVPTLMSSVVPAADLLKNGCAVFEADDLASLCESLELLITDEAAYVRLGDGLRDVREGLYDRKRSWGSQLCKVFLRL